MKTLSAIGIALAFGLGNAYAVCTNPYMNGSNTTTALSGNTVCVPASCSSTTGNCTWSEYHAPGGSLSDYKKGPTHPIDPSQTVGSWSVSQTGTITYTYTGGAGGGAYDLHYNGTTGSYAFCNGSGSPIEARVIAGNSGC